MNYTVKSLHYCNSDEDPTEENRTITFRIQDPVGAWSSIQTTIVQVKAINDVPIYNPPPSFEPAINILEDHNITILVLPNFYDYEETLYGNAIKIVRVEPDVGNASLDSATGSIVYAPFINDYGTRIIYYQACDSASGCSVVANLTIIIAPVNDPPYPAENLILFLEEDVEVFVNLTDYFGDPEDDLNASSPYPLVQRAYSTTKLDWSILDNGHLLRIVSRKNTNGNDTIILEVCDSNGECTNVPLTIVIRPVNDLPEIIINYKGDSPPAVTNEDTSINISITIYDIESDISTPVNFGIVDYGNGSITVGDLPGDLSIVPANDPVLYRRDGLRQDIYITYTPRKNFYGSDVIVIYANDSEGGYQEQSIDITVSYVNDPPYFGVVIVNTDEDTPLVLNLPIDLNVIDPEDQLDAGSFSIVSHPLHGTLAYSYNISYLSETGSYPEFGTLIYTPDEHFNTIEGVPEYFTIKACDNDTVVPENKLCTEANITVIVHPMNDAPILTPFSDTVYEDGTLTVNLSSLTFDQEDKTPPISLISIIPPYPEHGTISFDNMTGIATYIPNKDFFGFDNIYFQSCDTNKRACNSSGHVTVEVLDVNDQPYAENFSHITSEDDFDLIDIFEHSNDSESEGKEETDLKISIYDPTSGTYISDNTVSTSKGANLRIYQKHGIITYEPSPDFIGYDSFNYSVCDICDPRRQGELGITDIADNCTRQIEVHRSGITCAEATVTVLVVNTRDVPVIKDITGITHQGKSITLDPYGQSRVTSQFNPLLYFFSNASAVVYDTDDNQTLQAQSQGLNLTLFNLQATTNIDELSLTKKSEPHGNVQDVISNGAKQFVYTPRNGFSGYDEFNFEICDLVLESGESPLCSQATAKIFVTKPGPIIASITAISSQNENKNDTDSKVSKGDQILIEFSEETNMPPYNNETAILSPQDIDQLFEFPFGFIPPTLVTNRYIGRWLSKTQFLITINDEGYPQPESKVGVWTIAVKDNNRFCGGFNVNGQRITTIDKYCLLTSDTFSNHSLSTSPPLTGNWGLQLPDLTYIVIRNVDVDDDTQTQLTDKAIFLNSHIKLLLRQPLSYFQLEMFCQLDPQIMIDHSLIGENVSMAVVGCENKMVNGLNSEDVHKELITNTKAYFNSYQETRTKRQSGSTSVIEQPVASEITLKFLSFTELYADPIRNPSLFIKNFNASFNRTALASVIEELLGVDIEVLENYTSRITSPNIGSGIVKDPRLTPQVVSITVDDPDCNQPEYGTGDTITIVFDRDTDQPPVASQDNLDKILIFTPSLGTGYRGHWFSPSTLVVTIGTPGDSNPLTNTTFSLNFTENRFEDGTEVTTGNPNFPTDEPHCFGVNVCGTNGSESTVGICDSLQLSCRAYQTYSSITGDFSGGAKCEVAPTQLDWLWVLIAVLVLVVMTIIIILVYYCYRRYKQKRQREEAIRVVKRWEKGRYDPLKEADKKDESPPWAKPPDRFAMRDQPDPFKKDDDPLKNLPEITPRPPTAAPAENLPPIETIPMPFIPRAGPRIPIIPSLDPQMRSPTGGRISTVDQPSLTPLGLPRLTSRPQRVSSVTKEMPQLAPLKGPLQYYAQRAMGGNRSPTGSGALPGALIPRELPPVQATATTTKPILSRRISNLAPPALPPISELSSARKPFATTLSPVTSSDENINSTSETEGATTSDGGERGSGPVLSPVISRQPLPPVIRPPILPKQLSSLPPIPTMPPRRVSVDPFATAPMSPIYPKSPLPLTTPTVMTRQFPHQSTLSGLNRLPVLPRIPSIKEKKDEPTKSSQGDTPTKTQD